MKLHGCQIPLGWHQLLLCTSCISKGLTRAPRFVRELSRNSAIASGLRAEQQGSRRDDGPSSLGATTERRKRRAVVPLRTTKPPFRRLPSIGRDADNINGSIFSYNPSKDFLSKRPLDVGSKPVRVGAHPPLPSPEDEATQQSFRPRDRPRRRLEQPDGRRGKGTRREMDEEKDRTGFRLPSRETVATRDKSKASLQRSDGHPVSVPYSTAASVLLSGVRPVASAFRAKKRKMYKLYVEDTKSSKFRPDVEEIVALAKAAKVPVVTIARKWLDQVMQQLAGPDGATVHDGVLLDASPLPQIPIQALGFYTKFATFFDLELAYQSKEDAAVNGAPSRLQYRPTGWGRKPFVLWLHEIVDTQNIGAIARSAFYLGVDAIVLTRRGTGSLATTGAQKASAGASEYIPTLIVDKPETFMESSMMNGWQFYAAVAPESPANSRDFKPNSKPQKLPYLTYYPPLQNNACVLMLGNEDLGLPRSLIQKANHRVTITGFDHRLLKDARVDSMNVSVAAAILMERFLTVPMGEFGARPFDTSTVASSKDAKENTGDSLRPVYFGAETLQNETALEESEEADVNQSGFVFSGLNPDSEASEQPSVDSAMSDSNPTTSPLPAETTLLDKSFQDESLPIEPTKANTSASGAVSFAPNPDVTSSK